MNVNTHDRGIGLFILLGWLMLAGGLIYYYETRSGWGLYLAGFAMGSLGARKNSAFLIWMLTRWQRYTTKQKKG